MGLLSIFKRRDPGSTSAAASEPVDAVQRARTRARQRLIGAVVLVIIGIIGFPLVFETQPRPIPVDIPIEVPRKEGAPALVMPPVTRAPAAVAPVPSAASDATTAPREVITESRDEAGRDVTPTARALPPSASASRAAAANLVANDAPRAPAESRPTPKPEARPAPVHSVDAARARALLEGKPADAAAQMGRFVVQVGAFADASTAHEARSKAEKLGLKTYTQVVSTAAGQRIRVRLGPFANREEADRALAKARGAGLGAAVLAL